MAASFGPRRIALILYLAIVHLLAALFIRDKVEASRKRSIASAADAATIHADSVIATVPYAASSPDFSNSNASPDKLMIPVAGIKRSELQDTYTQSRAGGRAHNAIDIMAAGGTPVLAAADGGIAKFFDSRLGGITIYQWSADSSRIYYYAHLQRRAEGISEGAFVKRGTVIGYVGDTGDAGPGNFHLHFGISAPVSAGHYWNGADINPYPLLTGGIETPARRE